MKQWHVKLYPVFLLMFVIIGLLPLFNNSTKVQASTGGQIVLRPYYAANQIDMDVGYFNVKVTPNQQQVMSIQIQNTGTDPKKVQVIPYTAYTNSSGNMAYNKVKIPADNSLKVKFRDLVTPKKQVVTVPGQTTVNMNFQVAVPAKAFSGVILGGYRASEVNSKGTTQYKGRTQIKNVFTYGLSAAIRESTTPVTANLRLNTVRAASVSGNIGVTANIQNFKPSIISTMDVTARITRRGSTKTVKSSKTANQSMAPNSNYNYFVDWKGDALEAGDYTIYVKASQGGVKTWNLKKNFTITTAEANDLNDKAGFKRNYLWLYILIGVIVLILVLLVGYLVGRKKKGPDTAAAVVAKPTTRTRTRSGNSKRKK